MKLPFVLLTFMPAICLLLPFEMTERSRRLVEALQAAARKAGLQQKEVAYAQGLSEQRWNRQLAMRDGAHPSLARAGELPDEVLIAFAEEICARVPGGARVVRDAQINRLIDAMERRQERTA